MLYYQIPVIWDVWGICLKWVASETIVYMLSHYDILMNYAYSMSLITNVCILSTIQHSMSAIFNSKKNLWILLSIDIISFWFYHQDLNYIECHRGLKDLWNNWYDKHKYWRVRFLLLKIFLIHLSGYVWLHGFGQTINSPCWSWNCIAQNDQANYYGIGWRGIFEFHGKWIWTSW